MKLRILMTALMFLPLTFISAQDRPAQGAQKLEQVARELNLTPAQEVKLIPILREEAPKVRAIKANTSLTRMQKVEQLRAIHAQTEPQVRTILTPEQYQTLREIRRREVQRLIQNRQNQ